MPVRKFSLVTGQIYHIFSKSIADYKIFRNHSEYQRIKDLFQYYNQEKPMMKFSELSRRKNKEKFSLEEGNSENKRLLKFIAYCLMPTHFHFVALQLTDSGISTLMKRVLDSYSKYFNLKTVRRGPLWESRFKVVLVETDEQLLHLSRYVHLNPSTAGLVDNPRDWEFSSYGEFLGEDEQRMCDFSQVLDIQPQDYRDFVESRIDYQHQLAKIKKLVLEDTSKNTHIGGV